MEYKNVASHIDFTIVGLEVINPAFRILFNFVLI